MRSSFAALLLCALTACDCAGGSSVDGGADGDGDGGAPTGDAGEELGDGGATTEDAGGADGGPVVDDDMVLVPAGPFTMGCDACDADEAPAHVVTLSAYAIDRTETTRGAYALCVDAGVCGAPDGFDPDVDPTLPMTGMSWDDAAAYCAFAGKRLPTEAEWEKAARGDDGRTYPWGDDAPTCAQANVAGCGDALLPVGGREAGASPYGALDLAGNAWEWTADWYAADAYADHAGPDPEGPPTGTSKVYKGGSAGNDAALARASNRADTYAPSVGGSGLGFRCVR